MIKVIEKIIKDMFFIRAKRLLQNIANYRMYQIFLSIMFDEFMLKSDF